MAAPKTQKNLASVIAFLNTVADPARRQDCGTIATMMEGIAGEPPSMWGTSIVGFGAYRYEYANGRSGEWPIVGFSPRKQDITMYIMPGFANYQKLLDKLGKHKTGKSCLYLKRLSDIDITVLRDLITASVAAMESKRVRT